MSTATAEVTADDAAPKKAKKKGGGKLFKIIGCLLAMGLLGPGFVFVLVGLMPTIVVGLFDRSPRRYTYKTVRNCNVAAMIPSITKMLVHGHSSSILQEIMGDAMNWFIIYSSAIGGMMLVNIMPMMAQILVGGFHQTKIGQLKTTQKRIETEWGQEVTQFSKPEDAR